MKYVLDACLILLMIFMAVFLYTTFAESGIIAKQNSTDNNSFKENSNSVNSKGKQLFIQRCGSCHAIDKVLSAPSLRDVVSRGPWSDNKENFINWVKNPSAFMLNNQYAKELQKVWGIIMPSFESILTDKEIEEIYNYLKETSPQSKQVFARSKSSSN